jgi:hypothetical protein
MIPATQVKLHWLIAKVRNSLQEIPCLQGFNGETPIISPASPARLWAQGSGASFRMFGQLGHDVRRVTEQHFLFGE